MGLPNWIISALDRLPEDERGQDMIEYALMAGFIALAVAVVFPQEIVPSISTVFSKLTLRLAAF
jgi:Flp pilus assembly pilin Flp